MKEKARAPQIITVFGGLDPTGGAGILLDKAVIDSKGCFSKTVPTSLTAQNSFETGPVWPVGGKIIATMCDYILKDGKVDAVKVGLAGSCDAIEKIADFIRRCQPREVVIDPVFISSAGGRLASFNVKKYLKKLLFPMATMVTFNRDEAEFFTGITIETEKDVIKAGKALAKEATGVVIKGGHLPLQDAVDFYFEQDVIKKFTSPRFDIESRGTGCAYASLLTVYLLDLKSRELAIEKAKAGITEMIRESFKTGKGRRQLRI